jgi:plastocyanin
MSAPPLALVLVAGAVVLAGCTSPSPGAGPGSGSAGDGATVVKALGGGTTNVFDPVAAQVQAGGKVRWVDESGHHTVTFQRDVNGNGTKPDSGDLGPGQTFELAFPTPGTYAYRCIYHSSGFDPGQGMVGTVTVQ